MPADGAIAPAYQVLIAFVWTVQIVGGLLLGAIVQFVLIIVVIRHLMPIIGFNLVKISLALYDLHLPAQLKQLL
jgi:hypothetical protein